jgi:hypothetical protein
MELTKQDFELILQSLNYTVKAFEEYKHYPSYEYKLSRINDVNKVRHKILTMKKESKNESSS